MIVALATHIQLASEKLRSSTSEKTWACDARDGATHIGSEDANQYLTFLSVEDGPTVTSRMKKARSLTCTASRLPASRLDCAGYDLSGSLLKTFHKMILTHISAQCIFQKGMVSQWVTTVEFIIHGFHHLGLSIWCCYA